MKRQFVRVVVFLLTGAIANVAVAWGCVRWSTPVQTVNRADSPADLPMLNTEGWSAQQPSDGYMLRVARDEYASTVARWRYCRGLISPTDWERRPGPDYNKLTMLDFVSITVQAGWPMEAAQGTMCRGDGDIDMRLDVFGDSSRAPGVLSSIGMFPRIPVWPGFLINTMFYAAILWLLFAAPFALRRRVRIRRGLCPGCGYPVGTNVRCTECGATVKPIS